MLKYKINNRNFNRKYIKLEGEFSSLNFSHNDIFMKLPYRHLIHASDEVLLRRYGKDEKIIFEESKSTVIDDNFTFHIDSLPDRTLYFKDVEDVIINNGNSNVNALCFLMKDDTPHDFYEYKNVKIAQKINSTSNYWESELRRCKGDYVLLDNIFLLQADDISEDGRYIFNVENLNSKHDIYFINNDGEKVSLKQCFPPININGENNLYVLYWEYDTNNEEDIFKRNHILKNFKNLSFYTRDNRFFNETQEKNDNNFYILEFRKDSGLYKIEGDVKLDIGINESFETNIFQEYNYNENYVKEKIDENINGIIDMEKQIFHPINNENNTFINAINFNLKFKKRSGETTEDYYNSWKNNEFELTATTSVTNSEVTFYTPIWPDESDASSIGELGFSDEDIYYQKKAVKKSFLRLSFYDNMDRKRQSLLFYTTIFLDSNKLYSNYIRSKADSPKVIKDKNLNVIFKINNAYNRLASSEGYYLYLFPSLCKNGERTIYMKVEFNHAKVGQTVPMVLLKPNEEPKSYFIEHNSDDNESIKELNESLYVPIKIKNNITLNNYVWYVDNTLINEENDIILTFYEPNINQIMEK